MVSFDRDNTNIAGRLAVLFLIGGALLAYSTPSSHALLVAQSNATSSTCVYGYDYAPYCKKAGTDWRDFCNAEDEVGERFRAVCLETCRICKTQLQELDDELQAGNTVEIGFGVLFPQGDAPGELKPTDTPLLQGLQLWLDHAGARGFPVGDGTVKFNLFLETANKEGGSCEEYISKAEKLVAEHKVQFAIIPRHPCKTAVSQVYGDGNIIHFLMSGTNMKDQSGEEYLNRYSWYTFLSSDDYPRLFLKDMAFKNVFNVSVVSYTGYTWTRVSARTLVNNLNKAYDNGQSDVRVVHSYEWADPSDEVDPAQWDEMLQGFRDSHAEILIAYAYNESGAQIMRRVAETELPVRGVYVTNSPLKQYWTDTVGVMGEYAFVPGQWSSQAMSECRVFGSSKEYLRMYEERHGYTPQYMEAMATAGGIVAQLALQEAGTIVTEQVLQVMATMTIDTIIGRVRFNPTHRNVGRDPVLMQQQGGDLRLVSPAELATEPIKDFIDWPCRGLVSDPDPDTCTDDELAVFEGCMLLHAQYIDGKACSDRLRSETVKVWDGASLVIDVCAMYSAASVALEALEEYTHLGNSTLLIDGCGPEWFDFSDGGFMLPILKEVGGDVVVRNVAEAKGPSSPAIMNFPLLRHVSGNLRIEGKLQNVEVSLEALASLSGDLSIAHTAGNAALSMPVLQSIDGRVEVANNSALSLISLPLAMKIGRLSVHGNQAGPDAGAFAVEMPSLQEINGSIELERNLKLESIVMPQLLTITGDLIVENNPALIELSFADLYDIQGDRLLVRNNERLAFFNLAQAQKNVTFCTAFSNGDLTGNGVLLNVRTLWFERHNCEPLRRDNRVNICAKGYVLVHGEGDESRCDEDWRPFFIDVLIQAIGSIIICCMLVMYQARQYNVFYNRPEFTDGNPIDPHLCGFSWHASMTSFLLSTVDMVSDVIFIQIQIMDLACREYRYIITASLWVLVLSSGVSTLRVIYEIIRISKSKHQRIFFFPRPEPGRPFSILEWGWCTFNSMVNILLVIMTVACLEPLRMLPWARPTSKAERRVLKEHGHWPDWHNALCDTDDDREAGFTQGGFVAQAGEKTREVTNGLITYVKSLSFYDDALEILEDVTQFVLQVLFLVSCHPSESAAITTLLSVMFSLLRAGLKLTSTLSEDVVKENLKGLSFMKGISTSVHRMATFSAAFANNRGRRSCEWSAKPPDEQEDDVEFEVEAAIAANAMAIKAKSQGAEEPDGDIPVPNTPLEPSRVSFGL